MDALQTGRFFGETNRIIRLSGITLTDTDTVYRREQVGWHYHENAYFTFVLRGKLAESNKKHSYQCSAGSLLFHYRQEPHYNIKPEGNTRCFHLEFDKNYLNDLPFDAALSRGIFSVENPDMKFLIYKIFQETKLCDDLTLAAVQMLVYEIFGQLLRLKRMEEKTKPAWTKKLKEILHDSYSEKLSLEYLSGELNLHPIHLSRDFSKHFHCTLGEYVRKVRVEKSLSLMVDTTRSLTEISFECGFADQSHFLRCFKQIIGINPSAYRKLLLD
jgi:AraC family transcriptional regulator